MHFKLDENVPLQLQMQIAGAGYAVSSVFSEHLSGVGDAELLNVCREQQYTFVTLDNDFAHVRSEHEGIIILRLKSQGAKAADAAFGNLMKKFDLRQVKNKIVIVEEEHIRIRF